MCTKLDIATDYGGSNGSPESPEMHHCSSTTQPLGTPEVRDHVPITFLRRQRVYIRDDLYLNYYEELLCCRFCRMALRKKI